VKRLLAIGIAPSIIPATVLGRNGRPAPSNRITVAAIGLGFAWPMFLRQDTQFLAVCDVQNTRREAAQARVDDFYRTRGCRQYRDFREVLDHPDLDAVYIATPDHWHALITLAAARAGKHVYCQKPLTRTIAEGRAVVDAVRRYNIIFQHGTQQRHDPKMLFGCELVRNGYIGRLKHVKIGSPSGAVSGLWQAQPVPQGLDWDLWLGPAPWAPFHPLRIAAHPWYHISDYCMGYIAGWGIHHADSAMQASGLDEDCGPVQINARGLFPASGLFDNPYRWQMHYTFANGLTWHWSDCMGGGWGSHAEPGWTQHRMGITLEGSTGKVFIWRGTVDADPPSLLSVRIGPGDRVHLVRPQGEPIPDFIDCIRQGRQTCAPVEVAHRATTVCSIGAIGMLVGRPLTWDPTQEVFNDPEADRLRSRALREPWTLA
jgi:predicted dehydrogenase